MSNKQKLASKNKHKQQPNTIQSQKQVHKTQSIILPKKRKNKRRQFYIECQSCCQQYKSKQMYSLCNCTHLFCKKCLSLYCLQKINAAELITCPQQGCSKRLNQQNQVYFDIPIDLINKYKRITKWKTNGQNPFMKECPQCQEKLTQIQNKKLRCSVCKINYCKQCHMVEHRGDCQFQFQSQHQNYRRCPQCKISIEKNQGCSHMTCTCYHQFCYICLSDWPHECLLEDIPPNLINFIFYSESKRFWIGILYILGFLIDVIYSIISQNFMIFWQGSKYLLPDTSIQLTEKYEIKSKILKILIFPALLTKVIVWRYIGNTYQLISSTRFRYIKIYYQYFRVKWLRQCFRNELDFKKNK